MPRNGTVLVLLIGALIGGVAQAEDRPAHEARTVQEGVTVALSVWHLGAERSRPLTEGDDVTFRLELTDADEGSPLGRAYPAAWLVTKQSSAASTRAETERRVAALIGGNLLTRAALDMNTYQVVTLNRDASLSVLDPGFSIGSGNWLARPQLPGAGADILLADEDRYCFVSMPDSRSLAVIATSSWRVVQDTKLGGSPGELALQPDGQVLWVDCGEAGVVTVDVPGQRVINTLALGEGQHHFAFRGDGRYAYVTCDGTRTLAVVDTRDTSSVREVAVGGEAGDVEHSSFGNAVCVALEDKGSVAILSDTDLELTGTFEVGAGLEYLRSSPDGRHCFALEPSRDRVHVIDVAKSRVAHTLATNKRPERVSFSSDMAYVWHRELPQVLMIPLADLTSGTHDLRGVEMTAGGDNPGSIAFADPIVPAPGEQAVLIANAADRTVYYYREGMAAPQGSLGVEPYEPLAVLAVDRSLREKRAGTYETRARLPRAGDHDLLVFLDSPRIIHAFGLSIARDPALLADDSGTAEGIPVQGARAGKPVNIAFRLHRADKTPAAGLGDVHIRVMHFGSSHWVRTMAAAEGQVKDGVYAAAFQLPTAGTYHAFVRSHQLGLEFGSANRLIVQVTE